MKNSTRIILLIIAGLLIVGGITAAILSLVLDKPDSGKAGGNTTTQANAGATSPEGTALSLIQLLDSNDQNLTVEYAYDERGGIVNEKYYYKGVYYGQRWYYSADKEDHSMLYDAEGNEIGASKTTYNVAGSIYFIEEYANKKVIKTTEYDYYEDLRTPKKKTVKDNSGDVELAEVTRFDEKGRKTETVKFRDGQEIEKITYDENGNAK